MFIPDFLNTADACSAREQMHICFVLNQTSCESSGRPCAWNSNDGSCASSSQAAQTDFFSMIGGIDGVTSHFSCSDFNSDSVACDAEANCAFHFGGCKAAVNASQAALRMVGAPDVVVMFDKLDKLDQMCQDLTADQCSLALECEVNDPGGGSPTTCARSYDYWLAAAALACDGVIADPDAWGSWNAFAATFGTTADSAIEPVVCTAWLRASTCDSDSNHDDSSACLSLASTHGCQFYDDGSGATECYSPDGWHRPGGGSPDGMFLHDLGRSMKHRTDLNCSSYRSCDNSGCTVDVNACNANPYCFHYSEDGHEECAADFETERGILASANVSSAARAYHVFDNLQNGCLQHSSNQAACESIEYCYFSDGTLPGGPPPGCHGNDAYGVWHMADACGHASDDALASALSGGRFDTFAEIEAAAYDASLMFIPDFLNTADACSAREQMHICFVLNQTSCESSGRPCAWNSNDGSCASSSQAAQTDFFSMIGGIDGVTSHFSCSNFDSDSVACDAEANCAFHFGGCKAAVNASQAALRMVGAPDVVVMFDKLDKLDQMCQDLTADQCSLALECEVNDPGGGSPTTCARSYDYWLAAAALACDGVIADPDAWGSWNAFAATFGTTADSAIEPVVCTAWLRASTCDSDSNHDDSSACLSLASTHGCQFYDDGSGATECYSPDGWHRPGGGSPDGMFLHDLGRSMKHRTDLNCSSYKSCDNSGCTVDVNACNAQPYCFHYSEDGHEECAADFETERGILASANVSSAARAYHVFDNLQNGCLQHSSNQAACESIEYCYFSDGTLPGGPPPGCHGNDAYGVWHMAGACGHASDDALASALSGGRFDTFAEIEAAAYDASLMFIPDFLNTADACSAWEQMNICFVLNQTSCESSGRPCAWNSNDEFCASSSQAAQTDFFSMIGGIDGLTSHFSCSDFDSDSVACDAEANCAFHNGGCKAAVNASQAALRMVGAPEHYLEFDRLDKLDQMCQGLTADQCSLAKECEVVDGSPTTCARSGGYYIAAAALACEGAPTVSGQWGNWHETASEMLNMSVASAIEFFDYPGYRGCENTCEGRDVNETACGGMDFCDWDAALGRCYSAVGPDLCPIEWASADAFCSSVEASLACRAPSSAANASTCPSVCDWIEGAASNCSTPSSFRSILDETSSHTQTVFAHFFGCGDFSTQGECDAARGGGSCAWSAGVDECHPAVGAAAEALSDAGAPFAVARFESLSLLAHPDLCFALNDETSCVAEPSCEWIEDEYGSTSCALSEAYRLALAADACFGHSDMRRAAFAFGFPGGDASEALEHLPGNATAFPSAASFCPAWSLWMTCGTDRESCESDPECPADQCAPAWGAFEALFAARDAVTSDAIAACGTLARSRDAHSCEATVSPASSSRVSASDVSCAWDASALACEPSGAATYRAVVDSGLAPRAVAEFVRLDVDGVGPCSGLSAVDCDASRACGWDETSRGACGWSFEYYVASAANACADHAPDSGGSLFDALAEAVGVHNVSRARDVAGVERRPPYPGYVGCQLECEGAFVSREVCESKSRAHCAWSAVEGRCESVVGDAPCPEDQPARGWINVTHAVGDRWFDETFWESHHGIIRVDRRNREWAYYRRVDPRDRAFEPYHHVFNNWFQRGNRIDVDFEMYSTYDAALKRDPARRWTHCGGGQESERPGYGFPGECFPSVEAYWEHQDAVAAGSPPPPERRVRVATDSPSYESKGCRLRTAKGEACVTGGFYDSGEAFVETAFPGAFTVYLETPAPPELTRGGAFAPPQDANRATFLAGERELTGAGDLGLGGAERFTVRFKARLADNNAHQNATPGVLVITPADHPADEKAFASPARSTRAG